MNMMNVNHLEQQDSVFRKNDLQFENKFKSIKEFSDNDHQILSVTTISKLISKKLLAISKLSLEYINSKKEAKEEILVSKYYTPPS
ncbi:hypothetical protein Trichorick_00743 [Candidatus Trichorickettsia mobilis]|uniref:Uncharacterized protein n=1 Tax=Candidatus Trichorickettsia mobilis TaxID=1346319 RepID=A0ABZ0UT79_9RICK|nr:hypothetical protein [Candidatus Trichorickettsia mobilis]WPY00853.1 hypothetical protein Trichorick_00743 [Candidatus Trichorickettsia mobilis]